MDRLLAKCMTAKKDKTDKSLVWQIAHGVPRAVLSECKAKSLLFLHVFR